MSIESCRFCAEPLHISFCDLGLSPISNAYLSKEALNMQEPFYPLHAYVCAHCFLVQIKDCQSPQQIFSGSYAYFSSYSTTWLEHCSSYVDKVVNRFCLTTKQQVIEIASNDGYLLTYFKDRNIPILGIEPAHNVALEAMKKGICTITAFFSEKTAQQLLRQGYAADLLIGNNVLAHVPHINDFVKGMKQLLKPEGVITMEFPHLHALIANHQFDTIYHEHFSYFSFLTVEKIFTKHGLQIFDVEEISTHGGSLRIYATHSDTSGYTVTANVSELRLAEIQSQYQKIQTYLSFSEKVHATKAKIWPFSKQLALKEKK